MSIGMVSVVGPKPIMSDAIDGGDVTENQKGVSCE